MVLSLVCQGRSMVLSLACQRIRAYGGALPCFKNSEKYNYKFRKIKVNPEKYAQTRKRYIKIMVTILI
jgi:hypothetical protein